MSPPKGYSGLVGRHTMHIKQLSISTNLISLQSQQKAEQHSSSSGSSLLILDAGVLISIYMSPVTATWIAFLLFPFRPIRQITMQQRWSTILFASLSATSVLATPIAKHDSTTAFAKREPPPVIVAMAPGNSPDCGGKVWSPDELIAAIQQATTYKATDNYQGKFLTRPFPWPTMSIY